MKLKLVIAVVALSFLSLFSACSIRRSITGMAGHKEHVYTVTDKSTWFLFWMTSFQQTVNSCEAPSDTQLVCKEVQVQYPNDAI